MPYSLEDKLVVGISSRALFDLDEANRVFVERGLKEYRAYQLQNEDVPLEPGTAFPLVKALLAINNRGVGRLVEVILLSRNDADSGLRIFNSIAHHTLDITRAAFTDGRDPFRYLDSFCCKLFLSAYEDDVRAALEHGVPAALVYPPPEAFGPDNGEVRIAFDGDAVLFGDDSERIFQKEGLDAFQRHEAALRDTPLNPGPFKGFLETLVSIQEMFPEQECPIRTALVTARNAPAHTRPIKTLRAWKVRVDESFFLGGMDKTPFLREFRPHIFFDDQKDHVDRAASGTPAALVPISRSA